MAGRVPVKDEKVAKVMSLIDEMMNEFIIMEKRRVPDGEGGTITEWEDGATIKGVMVMNTTMEAQIADAQGVKSIYTFTTSRDVTVGRDDVLKNAQNGRYFRLTSDKGEIVSPNVSTLNMAQYHAEKWELT